MWWGGGGGGVERGGQRAHRGEPELVHELGGHPQRLRHHHGYDVAVGVADLERTAVQRDPVELHRLGPYMHAAA